MIASEMWTGYQLSFNIIDAAILIQTDALGAQVIGPSFVALVLA